MRAPVANLDKETLSRFEDAIEKEWIVTNGLGGYASSTVLGINTRKYHGLLVAAFHPPGDRRVCLAKLDEEVQVGNNIYSLGTNEFQSGIFPKGHDFLKEFTISPLPRYVYEVQNVEVQKTVFMPRGKNAVIVLYKILNSNRVGVKIRASPLLNWRHFHSVTDRWTTSEPIQRQQEAMKATIDIDVPRSMLILEATGGCYHPAGKWVENLYYREERNRGENCLDDCYYSGFFEIEIEANAKENFAVTAAAYGDESDAKEATSKTPVSPNDIGALYERECKRHEDYVRSFYETHSLVPKSDWLSRMISATDMFMVEDAKSGSKSVIAGYHWFEVWGRDTFVSLPGLMLVNGRFDDAKKTFLYFEKHCWRGLVPNYLPDKLGQPAFNTVDASLWFLNAILQYLEYTADFRFIQGQLWETLKTMIEEHAKGTAFGIHVDGDGLLSHGSQLTWMDAVVDGQAVTPRGGKAVEVQALWYNGLRLMELLARRFDENSRAEEYVKMAEKARKSFAEKFWNAARDCLYDVVGENVKDDSLRPNQIVAAALDFSMLDDVKSAKVIDFVQRELLTPYGLRTLSRSCPGYVGTYAGDRGARDRAYHNGAVWPWLLGPFTTAFLRAKKYSEYWREYAMKSFLAPLLTGYSGGGIGTICEIFDGDPPHKPRGCIAQAWSVAEPLRAYVEDILLVKPKCEREVLQV